MCVYKCHREFNVNNNVNYCRGLYIVENNKQLENEEIFAFNS